jgi:2'-hydroxyisoflavone reductase
VWVAEERLVEQGVVPWVGLPLWIPASDADSAGFMSMSCARAHAAGLSIRPLRATIQDTADWLAERDNAGAWKQMMSADAERALLRG